MVTGAAVSAGAVATTAADANGYQCSAGVGTGYACMFLEADQTDGSAEMVVWSSFTFRGHFEITWVGSGGVNNSPTETWTGGIHERDYYWHGVGRGHIGTPFCVRAWTWGQQYPGNHWHVLGYTCETWTGLANT
jgi:hypothetical protein